MSEIEGILLAAAGTAAGNVREECLNAVGWIRARQKDSSGRLSRVEFNVCGPLAAEEIGVLQALVQSRAAGQCAAGLALVRPLLAHATSTSLHGQQQPSLLQGCLTAAYQTHAASSPTLETELLTAFEALVRAFHPRLRGEVLHSLLALAATIYVRSRTSNNTMRAKQILLQLIDALPESLVALLMQSRSQQHPPSPTPPPVPAPAQNLLLDLGDEEQIIDTLPSPLLNSSAMVTSQSTSNKQPTVKAVATSIVVEDWADIFSVPSAPTTPAPNSSAASASAFDDAVFEWQAISTQLWTSGSLSNHSRPTQEPVVPMNLEDNRDVAQIRADIVAVLKYVATLASKTKRSLEDLTVEDVRANAIALDMLHAMLRGIAGKIPDSDEIIVEGLQQYACKALMGNPNILNKSSLKRFLNVFMLLQTNWGRKLRANLAHLIDEILLRPLRDELVLDSVAVEVIQALTQLFAERSTFLALVFGSGSDATPQTSLAQKIMAALSRCALSSSSSSVLQFCQLGFVQIMKSIQILHRTLLEGKNWAVMVNLRFVRSAHTTLRSSLTPSMIQSIILPICSPAFAALNPLDMTRELIPVLLQTKSHLEVENVLLSVVAFVFQNRTRKYTPTLSSTMGDLPANLFTDNLLLDLTDEPAPEPITHNDAPAEPLMPEAMDPALAALPPPFRDPEALYNYICVILAVGFCYHGHQDNTKPKMVTRSMFLDSCLLWCIIEDKLDHRKWAEAQYDICCRRDFFAEAGFNRAHHTDSGLNELMQHQTSLFPRAYPDLDAMAKDVSSLEEWATDLPAERLGVPLLLARARAMLKQCWRPALQCFMLRLGESDTPSEVAVCLEGLRRAAYIASVVNMERERDTFVEALLKASVHGRETDGPVQMLDCRIVHIVNAMLCVGLEQGGYLRNDSWYHLLRGLSLLERSRVRAEMALVSDQNRGGSKLNQVRRLVMPVLNSDRTLALKLVNTDKFRAKVTGLFRQTVSLNAQSLLAFVRALCRVTLEELADPMQFLLSARHLCHVLELNSNPEVRSNFDMFALWRVAGDVVAKVGAHRGNNIGLFVAERLTSILNTYMIAEKASATLLIPYVFSTDEQASVDVQLDGTHPLFERVTMQGAMFRTCGLLMSRSPLAAVRSACARSLTTTVYNYGNLLSSSGWHELFSACSSVRLCSKPELTEDANVAESAEAREMRQFCSIFDVYRVTVEKEAWILRAAARSCLSSLLQFCQDSQSNEDVGEAINCLRLLTGRLAGLHHQRRRKRLDLLANEGKLAKPPARDSLKNNEFDQFGDYDAEGTGGLIMWWDLLSGFVHAAHECPVQTQARVLDALFSTVRETCPLFTVDFCEQLVCEQLVPLLYSLAEMAQVKSETEKIFRNALCLLADLFSDFFQNLPGGVSVKVLDSMLELLGVTVRIDNDVIGRAAVASLKHLVLKNGHKFDSVAWAHVHEVLFSLLSTLPQSFLSWSRSMMSQCYKEPSTRLVCDQVFCLDPRLQMPGVVQEMMAFGEIQRGVSFPQQRGSESDLHHVVVRIEMVQLVLQLVLDILQDANANAFAMCPEDVRSKFLEIFQRCCDYAVTFNSNKTLRSAFVDLGVLKYLPSLLSLECAAVSCKIVMLYAQWTELNIAQEDKECIQRTLVAHLSAALSRYPDLKKDDFPPAVKRWCDMLAKVVMPIQLQLTDDQFKTLMPSLYVGIASLVSAEESTLREFVQQFFLRAGAIGGFVS